MRSTLWLPTPAVMLLVGLLVGCNGGDSGTGGLSQLGGDITVDGSSTVYLLNEAVANAFKKQFPKVDVLVGASGTGGGFKRFVKGETDISAASRPIKQSEFDQAVSAGMALIEVPIAYDGLTIVVNPENDWVEQLTVDQLRKIFLDREAAKTWADVEQGWPDVPIRIYAPGTDSGTFDYFREVMIGDSKDAAIRSDLSVSEDDNVLVTGVAGQKTAIGFFGAAYYLENKDKLKAVPIVNSAGQAVLPSDETVQSGTYEPFSRPLFIYIREESMKRPEMKKFVGFYLDVAAEKARHVGYVALPEQLYERGREHVKQRLVGTHFWTADGRPREDSLPEIYQQENLLWPE